VVDVPSREVHALKPATKDVIVYGVDLSIFKPGDRRAARTELGLPQNKFICLSVAVSGSKTNLYKDY
jgi:hypothetical protein